MIPKEKAEHLLDIMSNQTYQYQEYAGAHYTTAEVGWEAGKKCALIAVNEILNSEPLYPVTDPVGSVGENIANSKKYWQQVKKEIEKL